MNFKTNILYLYSELVGYQIPVLNEYIHKYQAEVYVVHWDKKKLKPFTPPQTQGINYFKRSEYNKESLWELCKKINPTIVYVSGWMDKEYLFVCKRLKKLGIPVVSGFDDMWTGSLRQIIGSLVFPIYFKRYFSHAWVAGMYQFEFAKRLGFKNNEIIFDLLTANTSKFNSQVNYNSEVQSLNCSFLYVGNFRTVKGVDILMKAYNIYREKYKGTWRLVCVGNGELEKCIRDTKGVTLYPFSSEDVLKKIASETDVFILPSRHDQWGVVVHEFTSLGMPLLLSEFVGARTTFLIEGYNGYIFKNNSSEDLAKKMSLISSLSAEQLSNMGDNSRQLASRINISTSAANFMSILK